MGGQKYIEHPGTIPQDFVNEEMSGTSIIDLIVHHGDPKKTQQFLKISFCGNYFTKKQNTPNIFYQLQLGINWDLSNIFGGKEEK